MEVTVTVHAEDGQFWSEVPELPGCFATGGTLTELTEAVAEGIGLYLWDIPAAMTGGQLVVGDTRVTVTPMPPQARRGA